MASKRPFVLLAAVGCFAAFALGVAAQVGPDPSIRLRNDTGSTILSVRLEPVEDGAPLQALTTPLKAGRSAGYKVGASGDDCVYDVTAELAGGDQIEQDAVNLCQLPDRTLILQD